MRNMCCALFLAASLLFAGQAFAAPQVFDSPAGKFSIDVPAGWTAKAVDMGCQIDDNSGKNSMSVQFKKAEGDPKAFAKALVEHMKAKVVKENVGEDGTVTVACKLDDLDLIVVVAPIENFWSICVMGGPDTQAMSNIVGTMKDAQ